MTNLTYAKFIQNILDTRGRFNCGDEYCERHHILPRCVGGDDKEENLIDLFAREHFIAHKLLAEENPNNCGLMRAYFCMAWVKDENQQRYQITAEEYEDARIAFSEMQKEAMKGENNPFYGKTHSIETRMQMRENHSNVSGKNNPMYGSRRAGKDNPFYGRKHTSEAKRKNSETHKGKKASEEVRKKMKEIHQGKNNANAKATIQLTLDGDFIKLWDYAKQASLELDINYSSIVACCRGEQKTAGGFCWMYAEEYYSNKN